VHRLEVLCELERALGSASLVCGIRSPRRSDCAFDEGRLALGGRSEPAQVTRLDADASECREGPEHAHRVVAVVLGSGQQ
jgi:hypothetical protein